jgi:hypothetical protein
MAVETMEFLEMLERMIRRAGVRVGEADEAELAELVAMRSKLGDAIVAAVQGQRANTGRSWRAIGSALGISGQSAWQTYGGQERPVAGVSTCAGCGVTLVGEAAATAHECPNALDLG